MATVNQEQKATLTPLSKQKSLLSQLLQEVAHTEDVEVDAVVDVADMEETENENGYEEEDDEGAADGEEEDQEMTDASQPSSSRPIRIRRPSENTYLRNQHEAHKRFLYLHLVDEMRKECEAYFARMARVGEDPQVDVNTVLPPQ